MTDAEREMDWEEEKKLHECKQHKIPPDYDCAQCGIYKLLQRAEQRGRTDKAAEMIMDRVEEALKNHRKGLLRGAEKVLEHETDSWNKGLLERIAEELRKEAEK